MFSREHWQIKLAYAGLGFLFAVMGMLASPLAAQRDKFGDIECTSLTLVDKNGNAMANLSTRKHGGHVSVAGKNGSVSLYVGDYGGSVEVSNNNEVASASLGIANFDGFLGGHVTVRRIEFMDMESALKSARRGNGATVSYAQMQAGRNGGEVEVSGVNRQSMDTIGKLCITENGGNMTVTGRGQGKVTIEVDKNGSGNVSAWDRNGNLLK